MLTNASLRLNVVLCHILQGNGGNAQVGEYRGVKHRKIKIESMICELEKEGNFMGAELPVHYNEFNAIKSEDELIFKSDDFLTMFSKHNYEIHSIVGTLYFFFKQFFVNVGVAYFID